MINYYGYNVKIIGSRLLIQKSNYIKVEQTPFEGIRAFSIRFQNFFEGPENVAYNYPKQTTTIRSKQKQYCRTVDVELIDCFVIFNALREQLFE